MGLIIMELDTTYTTTTTWRRRLPSPASPVDLEAAVGAATEAWKGAQTRRNSPGTDGTVHVEAITDEHGSALLVTVDLARREHGGQNPLTQTTLRDVPDDVSAGRRG